MVSYILMFCKNAYTMIIVSWTILCGIDFSKLLFINSFSILSLNLVRSKHYQIQIAKKINKFHMNYKFYVILYKFSISINHICAMNFPYNLKEPREILEWEILGWDRWPNGINRQLFATSVFPKWLSFWPGFRTIGATFFIEVGSSHLLELDFFQWVVIMGGLRGFGWVEYEHNGLVMGFCRVESYQKEFEFGIENSKRLIGAWIFIERKEAD